MTQNYIGENGIVTQSLEEIIGDLTSQFLTIYPNANLAQNSPDAQLIGIMAQAKKDILDFITAIYNNLNPDTVTGIPQQVLYRLNGLEIEAYTYSFVYVNVTFTDLVNISGIGAANINNADVSGFTVTDANGNRWILSEDYSPATIGTHSLIFRAAELGSITAAPNTINIMETVIAGISGVNNPAVNYQTGADGESASQFRLRRDKSISIPAQGFEDAIEAQLLALSDVTEAKVYNNRTSSTVDGIPAHTIWVIVRGGTSQEIAPIIYYNVPPGIPMRGTQTGTVTRANGNNATVNYDEASSTDLYIQMNIKPIAGAIDTNLVKSELSKILFNIGQSAESVNIATAVKDIIGETGTPYDVEVSNGGTASATISGTGITDATVDVKTFVSARTSASLPSTSSYVFTYTSSEWKYSGDTVDLADYGISIDGTPVNGDTITIAYNNQYSEIATPANLDEFFSISDSNISIQVI